jgi:hypothetical protein
VPPPDCKHKKCDMKQVTYWQWPVIWCFIQNVVTCNCGQCSVISAHYFICSSSTVQLQKQWNSDNWKIFVKLDLSKVLCLSVFWHHTKSLGPAGLFVQKLSLDEWRCVKYTITFDCTLRSSLLTVTINCISRRGTTKLYRTQNSTYRSIQTRTKKRINKL